MRDNDLFVGQTRARIKRGNLGVVPFLYFTEKDVGNRLAIELQRWIARKVVRHHDRARDRWDVQNFAGRLPQIVVTHRPIRCAEIDRLSEDLFLASARANRLVIKADRWIDLRILIEPLRVDRIGERRPGAVNHQLR
jgi:hypothetical protein